jgi:hypothetical protein
MTDATVTAVPPTTNSGSSKRVRIWSSGRRLCIGFSQGYR